MAVKNITEIKDIINGHILCTFALLVDDRGTGGLDELIVTMLCGLGFVSMLC